jgi:hypothetical protein
MGGEPAPRSPGRRPKEAFMDTPVLFDPNVFPSDDVLASVFGKAKPVFDALAQYNRETYPDFAARWKYYNDGKRWLMNVSRKKKTVFWLSAGEGFFKTSFYLTRKAESIVKDSDLSPALKKLYHDQLAQKFNALSVTIKTKKDIEEYKRLVRVKLACK